MSAWRNTQAWLALVCIQLWIVIGLLAAILAKL
jgi:hypothetical protein